MEYPGPNRPFSNFRNHLRNRLHDARTIVVNDAITSDLAGRLSEQLTVLDAESSGPIQVLMSSAPGGTPDAGLSIYDLIRSLSAPVTTLGSGRIAGAGVLAFVGAAADRRYALSHVRFQFREPREALDDGPAAALDEAAEAARTRRQHIVGLLAEATGRRPDQVDRDLSSERTFDAEAAVAYGLIRRVVQSRREIE
jgi:ATP-dependent Clp protease protease subunit